MSLNVLANGHFGLQSDQVTYIALDAFDASGNPVPFPSGDVDTASATGTFAASLGVSVGTMPSGATNAGDPAVVLTPLVLESDVGNSGGGIGISITDSSGLQMAASLANMLFDIVQDLTPVTVGLDTSTTATQPQSPPTAPGP